MTEAQHYDAVVIGAGQAGVPLSHALADAGRRTALIECQHVGGTCINDGCTPTKTMVASARVAHVARRAEDYGVRTGPVTVDMRAVRRRKRDIVRDFRESSRERIEDDDGVDLIIGRAHFAGPEALVIEHEDGTQSALTADNVFIDTGARPRRPDLPGLDDVPALDSTSIMELAEVPDHLLIIGGGYVGLEFGQMFRRFGADVTIVQRSEQVLTREDPDIAEAVTDILREDGVRVMLETEAAGVEIGSDGGLQLTVDGPDGEQMLRGSHLLIAAGRVPNTGELNLEAAGVRTDDRGHIAVNGRLETSAPGIYALGDVKGGPAFTHISYDDFRIVRTNLLEDGETTIEGRMVPYTVFIDPQLGRVGMTESQARATDRNVAVASMPMRHVARALEVDETRGLMKVVVDTDTEEILGCAILGIEGGEIASLLQVAMMGGLPYTTLRDAIFAHPTLAESLNNLFATLE